MGCGGYLDGPGGSYRNHRYVFCAMWSPVPSELSSIIITVRLYVASAPIYAAEIHHYQFFLIVPANAILDEITTWFSWSRGRIVKISTINLIVQLGPSFKSKSKVWTKAEP